MLHLRDQMKALEDKVLILFKVEWLTVSIAGMKIFELVSSISGLKANSRPPWSRKQTQKDLRRSHSQKPALHFNASGQKL